MALSKISALDTVGGGSEETLRLTQYCTFWDLTSHFQNHLCGLWGLLMTDPEAGSEQPGLWQWWSDLCAQLCQSGSGLKTGACPCYHHPVSHQDLWRVGTVRSSSIEHGPILQSSTDCTDLSMEASSRAWDSSPCLATGLPFIVSQQESCVSSAMGAGHSWPRIIRRLCVSWFNCNVAYLFEERFMNNKCSSIKSKIRFSSAAISPAISSPLFFPIAFIFETQGFIFHLQNYHTQECKSGVRR